MTNATSTPVGTGSTTPPGRPPDVDALCTGRAGHGPGLRWFIRRGATTRFDVGFRTKAAADDWIDWHRRAGLMAWRVGWVFRLRGDPRDVQIVDRKGNAPRGLTVG